jgi:uncharacterized protein YbjT (DUF2867 family)
MKVLVFGASGMVGQGVLRECLIDPGVTEVLVVGRSPLGQPHPKLREVVVPDVGQLTVVENRLRGYDGCFWCLGVSSVGMTEADYRRVTYDLTVSAATTLAPLNPGMTFVYVSGAGTDSTEQGRTMWARVKGQTENALLRLPFKAAYMFRPGIIRPMHGIHSRTRSYRVIYAILSPFLWIARRVSPNSMTSTERVGRAMLKVVREGPPNHIVRTRDINTLGG